MVDDDYAFDTDNQRSYTMKHRDRAVELVFDALRKEPADPEENRQAIVRAYQSTASAHRH